VRSCIFGLGRLDFMHMRLNLLFKFVKNCLKSSNVTVRYLCRLFNYYGDATAIIGLTVRDIECQSFRFIKHAVVNNHFASTI